MAEDKIRKMLDEEIEQELKDMYLRDPNAEGYSAATERLAKLYKLRIEDEQAKSEIAFKSKQLSDGKKDRWVKIGLESAGILLPLGFYGLWMVRGLKFEETGAFTSTTFRGLISRFRPGK